MVHNGLVVPREVSSIQFPLDNQQNLLLWVIIHRQLAMLRHHISPGILGHTATVVPHGLVLLVLEMLRVPVILVPHNLIVYLR